LDEVKFKFLTKSSSECSNWVDCVTDISSILTTLRQPTDFAASESVSLEAKIDDWSVDWIDLTGREGMTNYTHMIGSGHLMFYLKSGAICIATPNKVGSTRMRPLGTSTTMEASMAGRDGGRSFKVKPFGIWFLRKIWWMTKDTSILNKCLITGERMVK
jgi:hypothetical protein